MRTMRHPSKYLHPDHLGSTRRCTDNSGVSAGTCDFEPFGEIQPGSTCSVPTNFRFAGMEWDSDAGPNGLYKTWFRYYDPTQGRWMSVDRMAGHDDDPQTFNRYEYARNDPVNLKDPLGLDFMFVCTEYAFYDPDTMQELPDSVHFHCGLVWVPGVPLGGGGGGDSAAQRFQECLKLVGDPNKANLDLKGYWAAVRAANIAGVRAADVLAIWSKENSLFTQAPKRKGKPEVGAMQIKPSTVETLKSWNLKVPDNWRTDVTANLTVGALYYANIPVKHIPGIPQDEAAAAYNGGTAYGNAKNKGPRNLRRYQWPSVEAYASAYQTDFDDKRAQYQKFDDCMKGRK